MGDDVVSEKSLVRMSKFLSFILRHHPESIGLTLDNNGWVDVEDLLCRAGLHGKPLTLPELRQIVDRNDKKRFEISTDGRRIRARQGHSIPVDVELSQLEPPEFLYHGTSDRFLPSIREEGLLKKGRLYVHLSKDEHTALKVGKRHGKPFVLRINALEMHRKGYMFFLSSNGVWLTEHVPPQFIFF